MPVIGLCGYTGVGKDEVAKYLVAKHGYTRISFADAMRDDLYKLNPWIVVDQERANRARIQWSNLGYLTTEIANEFLSAGWNILESIVRIYGTTKDEIREWLEAKAISYMGVQSFGKCQITQKAFFSDGIFRLAEIVDAIGWDAAKREFPEVRRLLQVYGTEVGREQFGEDVWVDRALKNARSSDNVVITDVRFLNEVCALRRLQAPLIQITRPGHAAINGHASEQLQYGAYADHRIVNDGTLEDLHTLIEEVMECVNG